jgi:hypothetical protein
MKEQIIKLFLEKAKGKGNYVFAPEIKVRRTNDIIYISEIRQTYFAKSLPNYHVIVEVGTSTDKAAMPLPMMDNLSLRAIYLRLKGTGEKLLEIERIK